VDTPFRGKLVQYAGRAMRACEGKTQVWVYDYVDVHVPVLKRMHLRRMKTYRSLGFTPGGTDGLGGLAFLRNRAHE
jgi:superfamily II DNA or RNA helicase